MDNVYTVLRFSAIVFWVFVVVFVMVLAMTVYSNAASFNCGRFMSRHTGTPMTPLALDWARKFPHTSKSVGAVVVQRRKGMDSSGKHQGGHVSIIVELLSDCRAIVRDNSGQYEREICRNLVAYVSPNKKATSYSPAASHDFGAPN